MPSNKNNTAPAKEGPKRFQDAETQTEFEQKTYIPLKILSGWQIESSFPNFFWKPQMIILLLALCGMIGYAALTYSADHHSTSFITNSRLGLLAVFLVVLFYGSLYFPSSLMQRPHYAFWRIVLAAALCYCGVLVFILFQNKEDINMFFQTFFDKNLGKPLPEKSYGDDCRLYTPELPNKFANITGAMDMFISAHFFGWFFKMLIVRDWKFCMFLSVFFEFLELTFKHWLPNFRECWWDSVILDILVCNALGILCGHIFIKKFQMKSYKWTRKQETNKNNIFANFVTFMKGTQIDQQNWHVFSSVRRFYSVLYYILLMSVVDLSNFFNKYVLWIPASHYTLAIRIFLWGFLSIVCTREYYEYISNNMFMRVGPFLFVGHLILFLEGMILYKFSRGTQNFSEPFPTWVVWAWTAILAGIVVITVVLFVTRTKVKITTALSQNSPQKEKVKTN